MKTKSLFLVVIAVIIFGLSVLVAYNVGRRTAETVGESNWLDATALNLTQTVQLAARLRSGDVEGTQRQADTDIHMSLITIDQWVKSRPSQLGPRSSEALKLSALYIDKYRADFQPYGGSLSPEANQALAFGLASKVPLSHTVFAEKYLAKP